LGCVVLYSVFGVWGLGFGVLGLVSGSGGWSVELRDGCFWV
jgi:hypothetical protein